MKNGGFEIGTWQMHVWLSWVSRFSWNRHIDSTMKIYWNLKAWKAPNNAQRQTSFLTERNSSHSNTIRVLILNEMKLIAWSIYGNWIRMFSDDAANLSCKRMPLRNISQTNEMLFDTHKKQTRKCQLLPGCRCHVQLCVSYFIFRNVFGNG